MLRSPAEITSPQNAQFIDCFGHLNRQSEVIVRRERTVVENWTSSPMSTDCFRDMNIPIGCIPQQPPMTFPPYQPTPPIQTIPVEPTHPAIGPVETFDPQSVRIGTVGEVLTGGIVGHFHFEKTAAAIDAIRQNGFSLGGLKTLGAASLKAGTLGAGISAAASAVQNISAVSKGLITTRDAASNVSADTVGGLVAGATAGISAGAGALALRSFGLAGLPLTIGVAAAGALGGVAGNRIFDGAGLRDRIFRGVREMLS